jgi:hypothetical protein
MGSSDQRRSRRHLLGATAEVHLGPDTVLGVVQDVSQHGMGLVLPADLQVQLGDLLMVMVDAVAAYAITGTVRRTDPDGLVGLEFDEVLEGETLARVKALPLADGFQLPVWKAPRRND